MKFLHRRAVLRQAALLAAAGFIPPPARAARQTRPSLWSTDAGAIKVTPGPWPTPTNLAPDVHFENILLRMPDGVHLNAILYMPAAAAKSGSRFGTQLSADPYRTEPNGWAHRDMTGQAQDGFASIYLDVRGSGGSEGIPADEYQPAEYDDIVHVIDWISRQPWSNGGVGMYGTSYSAFNSIWTAAWYKPPALKAIFVSGGTDDRYTDDIHSPGGIQMMVDNSWALGMITDNATPGAPTYNLTNQAAMDRWNTAPWLSIFLDNQLDGPHYRRGSLAPDQYGLLTTPAYLCGGYLDMYQNYVPRIMRHAPAFTRGILGPWHHGMTWPGPVMNWRAIQSHWFDYYLNGKENGVPDEPRVAYYMPKWRREKFRDAGPIQGEFRFAAAWPDTVFNPEKKFYLRPSQPLSVAVALAMDPSPGQGGDLAELPPDASALKLRYYPATGGFSESIGPSTYEGYYGLDSREDDTWGLSFDTPPLRTPLEMLGFARAHLFVATTAPQANWIVRINDVAPDGTSYIVSYGFLNGTHRTSHTHPTPIPPGETIELNFDLFCKGYCFSPGHRIRVVVTNAYFPVVWPSPYPMVTTLFTGGFHASYIALPVLGPLQNLPGQLPILSESIGTNADDAMTSYRKWQDMITGETKADFQMGNDEIGCAVSNIDPAHATLTVKTSETFKPLDRSRTIITHTEGALRSTRNNFRMDVTCTLTENSKVIRTRTWTKEVKRQFV